MVNWYRILMSISIVGFLVSIALLFSFLSGFQSDRELYLKGVQDNLYLNCELIEELNKSIRLNEEAESTIEVGKMLNDKLDTLFSKKERQIILDARQSRKDSE